MGRKRYRIKDGILRFENNVKTFDDYLTVPESLLSIDFNEVEHIKKPLRLENTNIKSIDFKKVITVGAVYLPKDVEIIENLYWADYIVVTNPKRIQSARLLYMNMYLTDNITYRPLVYLSGTVVGYLVLRDRQRALLNIAGLGVYSPGNHMTLGDPIADKYPKLVADIDILAMERAEYIFFDLNNLSPGTCAELGYSIAAGWHKTKKLYYMYKDTPNFFINGLLRYMTRVNSLEEFINNVTK